MDLECVNQQLSEARVGAARSWVRASSGQSAVGDPFAAGGSSPESAAYSFHAIWAGETWWVLQGRKLHKTASEQQAGEGMLLFCPC